MSRAAQELRGAGRRLAATPAAVFLAVLTMGLGVASTARHLGLYRAGSAAIRRCSVVLACPRTSASHAATAGGHATPAKSSQTPPAAAANSPVGSPDPAAATTGDPPEKNNGGKTGGGGLTVPLPDFNAPELSRFISPL